RDVLTNLQLGTALVEDDWYTLQQEVLSIFNFRHLHNQLKPVTVHTSRPLYSFRISSAYFLTDTFLVRFFSRFSRPLSPIALTLLEPALSTNQRMFSSTLSYSPGSQQRLPCVSSIRQRTSEPDSRTPKMGFEAAIMPYAFDGQLTPLMPFAFTHQ